MCKVHTVPYIQYRTYSTVHTVNELTDGFDSNIDGVKLDVG